MYKIVRLYKKKLNQTIFKLLQVTISLFDIMIEINQQN